VLLIQSVNFRLLPGSAEQRARRTGCFWLGHEVVFLSLAQYCIPLSAISWVPLLVYTKLLLTHPYLPLNVFLRDFVFRAVTGSQWKWQEDIDLSHTLQSPHRCPASSFLLLPNRVVHFLQLMMPH
jgi:hypothetical protein